MKFVSVFILCVALSGCYQRVNENDIREAEKACGGRENLNEIGAHFDGYEYAFCRNGEYFKLNKGH